MLKSWSSYTLEEQEKIKARSPASAHYLALLTRSELPSLYRLRYESWLNAVFATEFSSASTEAINTAWSATADELLRQAAQMSGFSNLASTVLALGKLGAGELNLSSDVDLVAIVEARDLAPAETAIKKFRQILSNVNEFGWLLRVDFDLRPGGRFGPLLITPQQLRDYFWSQGETWERLAWVRARAIWGSTEMKSEIDEIISQFCYRKYIDFTLFEELKHLRARIHSVAQTTSGEFNLKLSRGGIRDIELFVHSLLIIHGGRSPDIRTHSTSEALKRLRDKNLLPVADSEFLLNNYWLLRRRENQLQAINDQQTHTTSVDEELSATSQKINEVVSGLLGPGVGARPSWPEEPEAQTAWLQQKGVSPEAAQNLWPRLLNATALSKKSERDEMARREFLLEFLNSLRGDTLDVDLALEFLTDFVRAVRAKATFFSLLLREPRLIRDLAYLFSVSPYLSHVIINRPDLLDSFVLRAQIEPQGDLDLFLDFQMEKRLLTELIGASTFLRDRNITSLGTNLSQTADDITTRLLQRLAQELNCEPPHLLALGKWGGQELGVHSDLDFVFVCEKAPTENQQRLARRFISLLSTPHRGGKLYAVDLRLRPSGASGPLILSKENLEDYLRNRALAWERQSYLRARAVAPWQWSASSFLYEQNLTEADKVELKRIGDKLVCSANSSTIDLKHEAGGLISIEFAAQIKTLLLKLPLPCANTREMIQALAKADSHWQKQQNSLESIYTWLRTLEQLTQLTAQHSGSTIDLKSKSFHRLARLLNETVEGLEEKIRTHLKSSATILQALDPLIS